MKKLILSLIAICSVYVAQAQSCVSVQQVSTNYATKQIIFDLKWGTCNNTSHLYRVWVFVDYRSVTITTKGAWGRATITATDKGTLVSANKGVWVTGSANATQRVTLTLNVVGNKFDWCAFAIDYPPNATRNSSNGTYALKGTAPFTVNGMKLGNTQKTYTGGCVTSITDATNNPDGFASGNYTTNDGACASCGKAYMQLRNHCGAVTNSRYSTYSNSGCTGDCVPTGSVRWTTCGFSYISNVSSEGNMTWSNAGTYCQNKGMRLPDQTELSCMCSHKGSLPGSYVNIGYWSAAVDGSYDYPVNFSNCHVNYGTPTTYGHVKCVK